MAPIAHTVALSHVDGVSDSARARELYKYFQPSTPGSTEEPTSQSASNSRGDEPQPELKIYSDVSASKVSSPDTALTAFSQLVAWRLQAKRAMISVIDDQNQYFIAESTKTLDLVDNSKYGPGDGLWVGCTSVDKAGRLCEKTIAAEPTSSGYPAFIVNDLRADARFDQLPFVVGPPYLRFYAGVPLITKKGIPIGSLFVVDERTRDGLTRNEIDFMGTMAQTIMKHMEMVREVEERRRGMKMSRGLASFVEGRSELIEAEADTEEGEGSRIVGQFETDAGITKTRSKSGSAAGSVVSVERKEKEYSTAMLKTEEAIQAANMPIEAEIPGPEIHPSLASHSVSTPQEDVPDQPETIRDEVSEESTIKILFSRAANLIREAFEVDGGAVFYDAQKGFGNDYQQKRPSNLGRLESASSIDNIEIEQHGSGDQSSLAYSPDSLHSQKSPSSPADNVHSKSSIPTERTVEILGFSTSIASSMYGDEYPGSHSFVPFDERALHTLLRRFPRGKLWTFDTDGAVSSSSDEDAAQKKGLLHRTQEASRRMKRRQRDLLDAKFLLRHFPGVRQLLFVPLWDAARSRWLSGCCVWSTEPTRVLTKQSELAFLSAFGNSVMAECSRIDTEIADQKKGDFIGSISHELRSPLHGILASAEFLGEEVTEGFSKGLVETIDSCGRTLLDTINHILDFSKINHFEKTWRKNRRGARRTAPRSTSALQLRQADLPMINLFADVDISVVCEEVIEGVFAGHVFQNVTAKSFDMVPDAHGKMSDPQKISGIIGRQDFGQEKAPEHTDVAVILDVDIQNYHFTTQPGAFRRVIMNLLGNALKYTSHGYVRIKLEAYEIDDLIIPGSDSIARSMVTLTVSDTGRGISAEFLRSKLFTPFAQENSLSSGTGLGLSIVRSIVALLEGEIEIDSEIGHGTQVRVTLPLLRELPKTSDSNISGATPKSTTSMTRDIDDSVSLLRSRVMGQRVALNGFDIETEDPVVSQMYKSLKDSVTNFLVNWYGFQVVPVGEKVNFIIANEASTTTISQLSKAPNLKSKSPPILVLCSHSTRFDRVHIESKAKTNCGFVAKPIGPLKLARALLQLMGGVAPGTPGFPEDPSITLSPGSTDLTNVFEELSITTPEVLDNSRMAVDSDNARKAIESPTPLAADEKHKEFPFPVDTKPQLAKSNSMPGDKESLRTLSGPNNPKIASVVLSSMETTSKPLKPLVGPSSKPAKAGPRLLLVDDNKINLTLLRTYMRKRKYTHVDEAENGLEAVKQVQDLEDHSSSGYDIIFMDISMPVLDGFGATRQIRAIEARRQPSPQQSIDEVLATKKSKTKSKESSTALVIALTGLASSQDQSEAFNCGIDLFLTKPVSFKEVGKLLDNWEANRERELRGDNVTSKSKSTK